MIIYREIYGKIFPQQIFDEACERCSIESIYGPCVISWLIYVEHTRTSIRSPIDSNCGTRDRSFLDGNHAHDWH